jgi:hypothetical protein
LLRFLLAGVQWGQHITHLPNAAGVTADCISTALAGNAGDNGAAR